jgi:hypothetical protein
MRDSEVVASIVAGDADGFAEAYDRYATPLYKYCLSVLGDPAGAADAVQDTFVIAGSRLAGLREPERLRAWLYAVARNECQRLPRAKGTTPALGQAPGAAGPPAELRTHTLALAVGQDPGAVAHRAAALGRAGSFGRDGFPRAAHGPAAAFARHAGTRSAPRSFPRGRATAAACATLAVIAVAAFALDGGTQHAKLAGGQPRDSASGGASAVAATRSGKGGSTAPAPSRALARTPVPGPATTVSAPSSPAAPTPGPDTASPATTASSQSRTPGPAAGTLEVFPPGGPLWIAPWGAVIWLTAQGGPVTWWITVPGGTGQVSVSPSSGTLAAGRSVLVRITVSRFGSGGQVTVYPGGTTFTIATGLRRRFPLSADVPVGAARHGGVPGGPGARR